MSLTNLLTKNPLILAPMAGLSDLAMRALVREFGADLTISEMISSNALVYESKKSLTMLKRAPNEVPFIAQIAGSDLEIIKRAVHILNDAGVDGIDFNCGCPVNKVVKQHAGSSLLDDLEHLQKILRLIKRENATGFSSIKIRLGFNRPNIEQIVPAIAECAPDMLAIHGRTRAGMYKAPVDYSQIALAKRLAPELKIIANGDICAQNAASVLELTGADGLMIGRAAVGAPWIFSQIKGYLAAQNQQTAPQTDGNLETAPQTAGNLETSPQTAGNLETARQNLETAQPTAPFVQAPSDELRKQIISRHFELMCELYGDHACAIFRKHLHEYSKGSRDASAIRCASNETNEPAKMLELISQLNWKDEG